MFDTTVHADEIGGMIHCKKSRVWRANVREVQYTLFGSDRKREKKTITILKSDNPIRTKVHQLPGYRLLNVNQADQEINWTNRKRNNKTKYYYFSTLL